MMNAKTKKKNGKNRLKSFLKEKEKYENIRYF